MKKINENHPIKIAFLGCGFATKIHSKTLLKFKNIERFYASRSEKKAIAYNKKFKGSGYFNSYESAINSDKIDVVLVATPPDTHLDLTIKAMKASKHAIVEKPPFFKSTDFDTITELQKETGTQVMIAENYFYKPNLQRLRELLKSDIIGDIKFLHVHATKKQNNEGWRNDAKLMGSGALFEGGIHWINFIANAGLTIKSVHGFQPNIPTRMDKSIQVVVKYEEGAIGNLLYSWEIDTLLYGVRLSKIYGTEGSITFESNGIFIFVRGKKWKWYFPKITDIAGYQGMFRDFIKALRSGEEPDFNLQLAKRDLVLIEKIYETSGA